MQHGQVTPITLPAEMHQAQFPFLMHAGAVPGGRLAYVDTGTPVDGNEALPVVLLHGSPVWSYFFRRGIESISRSRRVIAIDLPGFGYSRVEASRFRAFSTGALQVETLIRSLNLGRFCLVVHATAGPIGLSAATSLRKQVCGVIASNSFAWPLLGIPGRLGLIARVVSSRLFGVLGVYSGLLGWITARFSRRTGRYTAREREAIAAPLRRWSSRRAFAEVLRSLRTEHAFLARLESSLQTWLPKIPVLLLYGAHDNGYRAGFAERWSQMCPNSRLIVLEESGHFPLEDEPSEWIRATEEFLANDVARFVERIRAA